MFQEIINTLGQMDGKYQKKTKVAGTLLEVKALEYSQTSGARKQGLFLQTDDGDRAWVNLIGKFDPIDTNNRNRFEFLVWPFKADQATKASLYCWIQRAVPGQPPSNEPYHVPVGQPGIQGQLPGPALRPDAFGTPTPPPPAQAPNAPRGDVDPTRNSIESQTALKAATDLAVGRADLVPDMATLYDIVGANKTWLQTGTVPPNVLSSPMPTGPADWGQEKDAVPTDPNQDDSDLPPELQENYKPPR